MNNTPIWEDGDWYPLERTAGDVRTTVCVVGLGGSGLACIDELLDLGVACVGIDAGTVAGGAAGRNAGFLLAGYSCFHDALVERCGHTFAARAYQLTLEEIDRLAAWTPTEVRRTGSLRIAADERELVACSHQLAAMRADALPVETYSGPEGRGLLFPQDAVCNPLRRCRAAARDLIRRGAALHENSPAIRWGPGFVETPCSRIECQAVLFMMDGGLAGLIPPHVLRLSTVRLQMLGTEAEPRTISTRPVYRRFGYDYWQQLPDGRLAVGGLRDRFAEEEETECGEPTEKLQEALEAMLRDTIGSTAKVTHRWGATVSYNDSPFPVAIRLSDRIWAAGAYNGTGNVVGALYGRALARLAATGDRRLLDAICPR